jgi:Asp-tRNA(Asn)/Glu-tRNA(Gln) amidotransferase A subunit family amidase
MKQALAFLSLAEQARLIRGREISPVDLVNTCLDRIARWDPLLRSYITVCADEALAQAKKAEHEIASGRYIGPMHGIPYGVKDQICTRGIKTTLGSRILSEYVPDSDATVIERLRAAGAILLGKHNLHEFGKGSTKIFPFGQPRNPWNLNHSPSSSSSGSGVAVASGLCSAALGEDTGGSIRGPAEANGIVGLRPTFGRVSRFGGVMYGWNCDTIGPLTRTVKDCALILGAIAGEDERDVLTSSRPVPDYTRNLSGDLRGIRIGVVVELTYVEETHEEVMSALQSALRLLESIGALVENVALPLARYATPFQMLTTDVDVASVFLHKWLRTRWADFDIGTRTRLAASCLIPAVTYQRAMRGRALVRREILDALQKYDVLISPTNHNPPPRIDDPREQVGDGANTYRREIFRRVTNYPFSVANTPTIAIPMGFSSGGLPLSMQIAGRPFEEELVLRVADAYERNTTWHRQHPDVAHTVKQFQVQA